MAFDGRFQILGETIVESGCRTVLLREAKRLRQQTNRRSAIIDDFSNVFREVRIEYGDLSGFLFVLFGKRDAFGDGPPHRLGRMYDGYGLGVTFDDYFGAGTDAGH